MLMIPSTSELGLWDTITDNGRHHSDLPTCTFYMASVRSFLDTEQQPSAQRSEAVEIKPGHVTVIS